MSLDTCRACQVSAVVWLKIAISLDAHHLYRVALWTSSAAQLEFAFLKIFLKLWVDFGFKLLLLDQLFCSGVDCLPLPLLFDQIRLFMLPLAGNEELLPFVFMCGRRCIWRLFRMSEWPLFVLEASVFILTLSTCTLRHKLFRFVGFQVYL